MKRKRRKDERQGREREREQMHREQQSSFTQVVKKPEWILGWCKNNCSFALNFAIWYWNIFLNKCGYAIHHFNPHFSLYGFFVFVFFLLKTLLAVYFRLQIEMILEKKQIPVIFLFEFKMGHKAAETTHNINNTWGPGTTNDHTVQWWFKKFCKGDESLEDEECSGQPSELTMTNWEPSSKPILLQLRGKFPKNSMSTIPQSLGIHLKQTGKVRKLDKWVLRELTANQKMVILKYHLLLFYTTMNHFSTGMGCMVKRQPAMTSSVAEPRRSSKALPKAKLAPKKAMVTVSWSSASVFHYSFLSPSETTASAGKSARQMGERHCKLQRPQRWHWSPERAQPSPWPCQPHGTQQRFREWRNRVRKFCLSRHIHQASRQPTATSSSTSVTFCRENTSATSKRQDIFSKSLSNPETQIFFFLSWS